MTTNKHTTIIGIDLGTTNSVVAGIVKGRPQILCDSDESVLPSIVGLDASGSLVTGVVARNQLAAFPERTIASIKRQMGSNESVSMAGQTFTPQEISAILLRRLADCASHALGEPVSHAVITVPAFFDENQRQATREAGVLAGLTVERIINEPTAATLVYHADSEEQKHVVVYDFGGGTFDVSVVRFEAGVVEVLSSKGDTLLGGDDLDKLLLDHVALDFYKQHQFELRDDPSTKYRLLLACEAAKCKLSTQARVEINEEFIAEVDGKMQNLSTSITREDFEQMVLPLVDQTIGSVHDALREAGLSINAIDDLVLVGGSTRIPLVMQRLHDEFTISPNFAVDPDMAVALGAATQAGMLSGKQVGPVLVDITGHTLGVEAMNGLVNELRFSPIIKRNTPLPATYEEIFYTVFEEQLRVEVHVLQGESEDPMRNRSIGRFILELDQDNDNTNKENIDNTIIIRFDLSLDGTLTVTAIQQSTGNQQELIVDNALSDFQTDEREEAVTRLSKMLDNPALQDSASPLLSSDQTAANEIELQGKPQYEAAAKMLEQCDELHNIPAEDADDIETVTKALREAMSCDDANKVGLLSAELEDILFYLED